MKPFFEKKNLSITAVEKIGFRGFPMMFHPHMEILCVLEGSINVTVDGKNRLLGPGELCAVFPFVPHSYLDAPNAGFRLLLFSPEYVCQAEHTLFSMKPEYPFFTLDQTLSLLVERATSCTTSHDNLQNNTACGYLTALVGELLLRSTPLQSGSSQNSPLQNILLYCAEHFSEPISIDTVSEACFVSPSYISKLFTGKLGISFRSHINALRTNHAKHLLENTDLKITDILYACGFQNQSSFNRVFLEHCGQPPRQYRLEHTGSRPPSP